MWRPPLRVCVGRCGTAEVGAHYLELPLLGVCDAQNATIEGPVLNSGKVPLYRVEILPGDFHATI